MNQRADEEQIYSGRLGRTSKTSVLISSHAGPVFPASVYTSVNVTQDPALRDQLAQGALNEIACPFGDHTYHLAIPLRYHDEERRFFALLIPEALRHEEFKHRSDLLQEMAKEREVLPDYVRHFHTVFSFTQLQQIIEDLSSASSKEQIALIESPQVAQEEGGLVERTETFGLGSIGLEESSSSLRSPPALDAQVEKDRAQIQQEREAIRGERAQLEERKSEIDQQQEQLREVSSRLERERERMEEIEMSISTERSEIDAARAELAQQREALSQQREALSQERQKLEAQRLNLEQRQRDIEERGADTATPDEKTQVVTDDQFIEVVTAHDDAPEPLLDESEILEDAPDDDPDVITSASLHTETSSSEELPEDDFAVNEATQITQVPGLDHVHVSAEFDRSRAGLHDHYTSIVEGSVVASHLSSRKSVDAVLDADPQLFLQYAAIEGTPVVAILLASLDDQQQLERSFAWLLDPSHDHDRKVIDLLARDASVRFAFYDRQNRLLRTYDIKAPLEPNVAWIKKKVEQTQAGNASGQSKMGRFAHAAEVFFSSDYERLGTMRHSFNAESFSDITTPEQAKLAAGIVGYWSTPDVFDYLIGNRAFPLESFRAIQRRVAEAALNMGIYLNKELRQSVLDAHLVDSPRALCRRLMANFAEVSIGLKPSNLDPLEIWENWDALLSLADEVGATPDQDVVELAQASLRRAQEFQEDPQVNEQTQITAVPASPPVPPTPPTRESVPQAMALKLPQLKSSVTIDELVVAKRSENTGVTYYLPDDAVLDQFDDMASMSREDLLMLLEDRNGRLEAAQMLVERFGAEVLPQVLEASEEMLAAEVVALAKFVETRADGLETVLVKALESGGPSSTYIASSALSHLKSTSAISVMLDALRDNRRSGNRRALAEVMSRYDDKIHPALMNLIKRNGHDDAMLDLLVALERRKPETLSKLSKDRHRRVREAARHARRILDGN